jgi:hypothetical protein
MLAKDTLYPLLSCRNKTGKMSGAFEGNSLSKKFFFRKLFLRRWERMMCDQTAPPSAFGFYEPKLEFW